LKNRAKVVLFFEPSKKMEKKEGLIYIFGKFCGNGKEKRGASQIVAVKDHLERGDLV
jgi:hypothetical protein